MNLELRFLLVAVLSVIAAAPLSMNIQQRSKALNIERRQNDGLHIEVKSLERQLQDEKNSQVEIRKQNEQLKQQLQAKIEREDFLATLTFEVGSAEAWRVRDALAFYIDKGFSRTASAYIVGNLVAESGLRENGTGDGGLALGLAQWHPGRRVDMPSDFHGQLNYVLIEMQRSHPNSYNTLVSSPSPGDAAYALKTFEGYGVEGLRWHYAAYILERI